MKSLYNLLIKHGQTFSFGLGAILSVLYYIIVFKGLDGFESLGEDTQGTSDLFNFGLKSAMGLVYIAAFLLLAAIVYSLAVNFKGSLKILAVLALVVVIYFITYGMADPSAVSAKMAATMKEFHVDAGTYKMISASISTSVSLIVIAGIALIGSAISNMFK